MGKNFQKGLHLNISGAFIMTTERSYSPDILGQDTFTGTEVRAVEVHEVDKNLPWVVTIDSGAEVIPSNSQLEGNHLRFNHIVIRNPGLVEYDLGLFKPALIVLNPDSTALSVDVLAKFAPVVVVIDRNSSAVNRVEDFYREGAAVVLDKASDPRILNAAVNEELRKSLIPKDDEPDSWVNTRNSEVAPQVNPILEIGALEINMEKVETKYNGEVVKLTARELDIVLLLAKNRDRVVSGQAIVETVWEHAPDNHTFLSMRVHLSRLRKKMPGLIETIRKRGYIIKSPSESQS